VEICVVTVVVIVVGTEDRARVVGSTVLEERGWLRSTNAEAG